MVKSALYPGTFDPITNGHLDILKRSKAVFQKIIVAVNANPTREFLFTAEERVNIIREVLASTPGIEVKSFQGLLVDYAREREVSLIIRGLRALSDFEYEFQMDLINRKLNPQIEMIYFMTNQKYSYLSSSIIKEISKLGGNLDELVPPLVKEKLKEKFSL